MGWKKYHHEKRPTRILDSGHGRELAQVGNKNFFNKVSQEMVCRLKKFKACAAEKKGGKPTNVSTCMGHAGKQVKPLFKRRVKPVIRHCQIIWYPTRKSQIIRHIGIWQKK